MVPDHLQVPGPAHGPAQEEPWEEKEAVGAAQKKPSIQLQPKETQPFPESGEEQDSVGKERRRREDKGHRVDSQKLALLILALLFLPLR